MTRNLVIGGKYHHFKNKDYVVLHEGLDCETLKPLVVYQALYGEHQIWVRDKEEFLSEVDRVKYPDVEQKYRFEKMK